MESIAKLEQSLAEAKSREAAQLAALDRAMLASAPAIASIAMSEVREELESRIKSKAAEITAARLPQLAQLKKSLADMESRKADLVAQVIASKKPLPHEKRHPESQTSWDVTQKAYGDLIDSFAAIAGPAINAAGLLDDRPARHDRWQRRGQEFVFTSMSYGIMNSVPEFNAYRLKLEALVKIRGEISQLETDLTAARALQLWKDA